MDMKERITALLVELKRGVYDKDTEINLGLLAAIAARACYC